MDKDTLKKFQIVMEMVADLVKLGVPIPNALHTVANLIEITVPRKK